MALCVDMVTSNPLLKREESFSATAETSMSLNGVVHKTGILLLICIATAVYGWSAPEMHGPILLVPILVAAVLSFVAIFKPSTSPIIAPIYAALEGVALGAISSFFNVRYPGIAPEAVILTFCVLGLFLFLYATRIVQVTRGMWIAVMAATGAVCLLYFISMILGFFGHSIGLINSSSPLGIGFSLLVCGIAAFNFFLDFAAIEGFVRSGSPKYMEWYAGLSLLITLVWLYLEILRLLSKLQSRR
jgi:uncharacterized YccA/Bax inhibitor family protein